MWCIQTIDSKYRERMYNILSPYEEKYDPENSLLCLDEKPKQLIEEIQIWILCSPGKPAMCDNEYKRNGTYNIFLACEPLAGKRIVKITEIRAKQEWAYFLKKSHSNEKMQTKYANNG